MATLRNKRKLAAVSRETPKSTRNSRVQNTLDPESTQYYISQVSEEIEGRVTKKLSKEFSRTESRILGALSKLDEFLLNPQVRTCSVAVPGASRNNNSENRETTGARSLDDPFPEVRYSSHHSGQLNSPETENDPHTDTYDFRKFFFPDAFKHVRLHNTFNGCRVHQLLPLTVDYACFLVKCINYQNVMCIQVIYFLQDLASFLQKMHLLQDSWNTTLANFLQKMRNFCKTVARFLRALLSNSPMQGMHFLQEFCKSCIDFCKIAFLVN